MSDTRQFKDAYKITHSAINELASYLNQGWPECVGNRSIQSFLISFTEDLPEDAEITSLRAISSANATLAVERETEIKQLKAEREAKDLLLELAKAVAEKLYEGEEYMTAIYGYDDKAEKLKREKNDGYGWNFFMGMRHGIVEWQMRSTQALKELRAALAAYKEQKKI